jgi:hypothetical protein
MPPIKVYIHHFTGNAVMKGISRLNYRYVHNIILLAWISICHFVEDVKGKRYLYLKVLSRSSR